MKNREALEIVLSMAKEIRETCKVQREDVELEAIRQMEVFLSEAITLEAKVENEPLNEMLKAYLIQAGYGSAERVDELIKKHGEEGVLAAAMKAEANHTASNKLQMKIERE